MPIGFARLLSPEIPALVLATSAATQYTGDTLGAETLASLTDALTIATGDGPALEISTNGCLDYPHPPLAGNTPAITSVLGYIDASIARFEQIMRDAASVIATLTPARDRLAVAAGRPRATVHLAAVPEAAGPAADDNRDSGDDLFNDDDDFDDDFDDDAEIPGEALPDAITLHVTRADGFPITAAIAESALAVILPSLKEQFGDLGEPNVELDDDAVTAHVTLTADRHTLATAGAGRDAFNAAFPLVGVSDIVITSTVAQPDNPDLAAVLAVAAEIPPVPDGQHPINGVLAGLADEDGQPPTAEPAFTVRYEKLDGQPLSEQAVRDIIAHPISAALHRFGQVELDQIRDGETPAVKFADFTVSGPGEIDLATLAVSATRYAGQIDFGGEIGAVRATGSAELVA